MLEASHHALIQYKLPTSGEVVPLLQFAPSKTDEERPRGSSSPSPATSTP